MPKVRRLATLSIPLLVTVAALAQSGPFSSTPTGASRS